MNDGRRSTANCRMRKRSANDEYWYIYWSESVCVNEPHKCDQARR